MCALDPAFHFSQAASAYDTDAVIQKTAAARVLHLLSDHAQPRRILDLGCGSGQLTSLLHQRWPAAQLDAVDLARGMIEEARRLHAHAPNIRWIEADAGLYHEAPYDLVASNCALHWMYPLDLGLRNVASLVARGGTLAISIMLNGTLRELHESRRFAAPAKPPFAQMPSAELVATLLSQTGLAVLSARTEEIVNPFASCDDLMRHLRRMGLTGGALSRSNIPLTRGELTRLRLHYNERYRRSNGYVTATYHLGYFLAERL